MARESLMPTVDKSSPALIERLFGPFVLVSLLLSLPSCLEYNPFRKRESTPGGEQDSLDEPDSALFPSFIEICDGLDNDGDGAADEGFEDADDNGVKDCLECTAAMQPEGVLEIREDCGPDWAVEDPWNMVVEWEVAGLGAISIPSVVADIDGDAVPELVVQNMDSAGDDRLYVLDGRSGALEWSTPSKANFCTGLAVFDLEGDGLMELITQRGSYEPTPVMLESNGDLRWTGSDSCSLGFCLPMISDLDHDSRKELVYGADIYNARTGAHQARLALPDGYPHSPDPDIPVVGDMDLDGTQEIAIAGCVFDHDYQRRWCRDGTPSSAGCFAALLQYDRDPEAEVLFLDNRLSIYDTDGSLLVDASLRGGNNDNVSSPSIADFDGDGQVEVALAMTALLQVWELDGTLSWSKELFDGTNGRLGIVGFDFDADGASELVVTDGENLYVLDGRTGEVRITDERHFSGTVFDHPLVVDIDDDGAAEIVLASSEPTGDDVTLRVFGHADDAWPPTGTHWPSYDFQVTNIREDGSLCTEQPYPWQEWNLYRARPAAGGNRPDLVLVSNDACGGTCQDAGFAEFSFQVGNAGLREAWAGATVSLYRLEGEQRVLITEVASTDAIPPGTLEASMTIRAPISEIRGATLQLEVSGEATMDDCDASNDIVTFDSPC
jgi:outer membrane protein assembly factor BamB